MKGQVLPMECHVLSLCKNWKVWIIFLGFLLFCQISFNLSLRKRSIFAWKIDLGSSVEYNVDTVTGDGQSIVVRNISVFDTNGTLNIVLNTTVTETRHILLPCPQKPTDLGEYKEGRKEITARHPLI